MRDALEGARQEIFTLGESIQEKETASRKREDELKEEISSKKSRIAELEAQLKFEKNRAAQALDVADGMSAAASGLGRLVHRLVDEDLMESLRHAKTERDRERNSRRPGALNRG